MAGGYNTGSGGGGVGGWDIASAVSQGFGSVLDYFGGKDERAFQKWLRDYQKSLVPQLQTELSNPAISETEVPKMAGMVQRAGVPALNDFAKMFGGDLESGHSRGAIMRKGYADIQNPLLQMLWEAKQMNANKRQNVMGMLSGIGG